MTKQVIANELGFAEGSRRRKGEVFTISKNLKGDWFEDYKTPEPKAEPKAARKTAANKESGDLV